MDMMDEVLKRHVGTYSDLTIVSGMREFKVHKFVLCGRSDWFEKATKKDAFVEGRTGVIKMDHDDSDAIAAMLAYLYTGTYEVTFPRNMSESSPEAPGHIMMFHLQVYTVADQLRIVDLKLHVEERFQIAASEYWKDPSFPATIQFAYSVAPPGLEGNELRKIVVELAVKNAKHLFTDKESSFSKMMEGNAEFGRDLSKRLAGKCFRF
ncbi:hypothetical protein FKW77_008189 [Venturia effusa]|uniref:BTB domain-containing protein n=1 Tax=Venturia effusa TaxID=50376 RepID=A0A517L1R0_9PEZI|nr:hypothetical protein FKW77_008189 [Venturia effusa]